MALERTISEPMPDNDVAIASGRLKARKSVSGSGRRTRNGSTTRRVRARAPGPDVVLAVDAANGAELLGHRVGGCRSLRRLVWPALGESRDPPQPRPASR